MPFEGNLLTLVAGRVGSIRRSVPPRVRTFAMRTDSLAGPRAMKRVFAPETLANLGDIPRRQIA